MAAIGNATRHGFLVREGDALERLAQVRRVCFDKTGTLTTGEPQVVAVCAGEKDVSEDALLAVAGAADIALVNDDIAELPHLLRLARRMMTTIRINLTFSTTLNFIAIALAISGVLNPVVGRSCTMRGRCSLSSTPRFYWDGSRAFSKAARGGIRPSGELDD